MVGFRRVYRRMTGGFSTGEVVRLLHLVMDEVDRLPPEDVANVEELLQVREDLIAYEHLCSQLYEHDIRLSSQTRDMLASIGAHLDADERYWRMLDLDERAIGRLSHQGRRRHPNAQVAAGRGALFVALGLWLVSTVVWLADAGLPGYELVHPGGYVLAGVPLGLSVAPLLCGRWRAASSLICSLLLMLWCSWTAYFGGLAYLLPVPALLAAWILGLQPSPNGVIRDLGRLRRHWQGHHGPGA